MAISEFTEIVLNIAAEVAGYSKTAKAKKNQQPPLMQESIGAAAGRNVSHIPRDPVLQV